MWHFAAGFGAYAATVFRVLCSCVSKKIPYTLICWEHAANLSNQSQASVTRRLQSRLLVSPFSHHSCGSEQQYCTHVTKVLAISQLEYFIESALVIIAHHCCSPRPQIICTMSSLLGLTSRCDFPRQHCTGTGRIGYTLDKEANKSTRSERF